MPAYGCAGTITRAIDSVLKQKVELELIVINDCSPDELDQVMESYTDNPVILYVKNEKNLGAAESRNKGIAMARGKYVAFLDADDWWADGKLKKQLALMEKTGCVLSCTARELVTPDGKQTGKVIPVTENITYRQMLHQNWINCSSVVLRTEVARDFPMEHEDSHEDYITWLRILKRGGFAAGINKPYLKYRLSEGGKSRNKLKSAAMTYQVYRYVGYGPVKSLFFFVSYAVHGVWKYR